MNKQLIEFFQGEGGVMSMARLTLFLSFWVASWCIIMHTVKYGLTAELLGVYVMTYAGSYVGGKWMDRKKGDEDDSNPPVAKE